ncbi:NAD-binding protein [Candidatus Halobeggiatoa sp. HSG11]|nr:NAD-binding protein [Candidatus Halobeggiatoa sp. HSG11]
MNTVTFLIMRRMRTPLLVLLTVYAIAIVGMTLMPGKDNEGNLWYMDFFHASYFVSYMGSTIGFGEIPYEFSRLQRMWVIISMYLTVIAWIYAIGALLALLQDEALRHTIIERRFARIVNNIHEPFYLICGYGDTGQALVSALEEKLMRSVVIEIQQERINVLTIENYSVYVPKLCADVSKPIHLVEGGLKNTNCAGVVAITNDNLANLHVAITAKLLRSEITVIGRVDSREVAANMDSFGTDYIINPFDIFARKLHTALHTPDLLLLHECLTNSLNIESCESISPPQQGLWVLCGYGRFGKAVYEQFKNATNIQLIVIEAMPNRTGYPAKGEFVTGRGTEAHTLQQAHIEQAVGIVAGTDDDVNNLSIVMTAKELNPKLFVVIRQNKTDNQIIFTAAKADIVMQPSKIIASHIRVLLTTPSLVDFMRIIKHSGKQVGMRELLQHIKKDILHDTKPDMWEMTVNPEQTPTIDKKLSANQEITMDCLLRNPRNRNEMLECLPLLLIRGERKILLPDRNQSLAIDDKILWCGKHGVNKWMEWTLQDQFILDYLISDVM